MVQTQCENGPTNLNEYAVGARAAGTGVLCAGTLSPAYAMLLLQHLLAVTHTLEELVTAWNDLVHYRLGAAVTAPRLTRLVMGHARSVRHIVPERRRLITHNWVGSTKTLSVVRGG